MSGAQIRLEADQEWQKWLAWHVAALPLSKKFPTLEKFVGRKPRQQSPEEMLQIARIWDAEVKRSNRK